MKHLVCAGAIVLVAFQSTPAAAQSGAMWQDDKGRMMELNFLGGGPASPTPVQTPITEMTATFHKVCVEPKGEFEAVASAATALGLMDKSSNAPTPKDQPPSRMLVATGDGLVVSQARVLLNYRQLQCNATFDVPELPEIAAIEADLASVFGRPADNDGERVKKNGKPNKSYRPTWTVTGAQNQQLVVSVNMMSGNQYMNGNRVFFGMREAAESKK